MLLLNLNKQNTPMNQPSFSPSGELIITPLLHPHQMTSTSCKLMDHPKPETKIQVKQQQRMAGIHGHRNDV